MWNCRLYVRTDENTKNKIKELADKEDRSISYIINNMIRAFFTQDSNKIISRDKKFKSEIFHELHNYGAELNSIAYKLDSVRNNKELSELDKALIREATTTITKEFKSINNAFDFFSKRL